MNDTTQDKPWAWTEHPEHPATDWQAEVAQDDTRLGYRDWVEHQLELQRPPDKPAHPYELEVRSLCERLVAAGARLLDVEVEGESENVNTVDQAVDEILSVDESVLYVYTPAGRRLWLYLVLGYSPGELVANCVAHPFLDKVTDEHTKEWEGR